MMKVVKGMTAMALVLSVSGCAWFERHFAGDDYSGRAALSSTAFVDLSDDEADDGAPSRPKAEDADDGAPSVKAGGGSAVDSGPGAQNANESDAADGGSSDGGDDDADGSSDDGGASDAADDNSEERMAAKAAAKKAEGYAGRATRRAKGMADDHPNKEFATQRARKARVEAENLREEADRMVSEWKAERAAKSND